MKRTNRIFSKAAALLFILLLSYLVIGQIAFAEGDGTGGGSSEPLSLVSSSISNGATGVSVKPSITLTFSKNIVNMSVSANNKNCFSLLNANGANVPIDIIFADDQIDREKRNDALIIPKANLAPGTNYTLVVSSALRSKSGVTMGSDIRISFTTEGSQPQPNQSSSVTAPKPETSAPPTPSTSTSKSETSSANATSTNSTTTNNGENTPAQDAQTAANVPSEEQASDVTKEDANKANQENIKKPKPYQAVDSISTESKSDKQESNSSSTWVVAVIITLLGATATLVYFYKRKKRTAK